MKKEIIKKLKKIKLLVLDFDGVMTNNKVIVDEDGKESVICDRRDGLGLEMLRKKGIEVIVISKETTDVVKVRCNKLWIKYIDGIDDKATTLCKELSKRKLAHSKVCFVGNDVNDIDCIKTAGIGIAVADAHPEVIKIADLVTKNKGGDGAVRWVCEWILKE